MANCFYTGNTDPKYWSVQSNWSAGTKPTTTGIDAVYSNSKSNIIIDEDINIESLNNTSLSPGSAGGGFLIDYRSGLNRNIISGRLNTGAVTLLTIYSISGQTISITGNTNGPTAGTNYGIFMNGYGTLNISGNTSGGTVTNTQGLYVNGASSINIIGDMIANGAQGLTNNSSTIINITGNTTSSSSAVAISNLLNGIINYSGSPTLTNTFSPNINNAADGVLNIRGEQRAPSTQLTITYSNSANGIINIIGDCYGKLTGTAFQLVNNGSTGIVNITGNVITQSGAVSSTLGVINNASTGIINVFGNVIGGAATNTIGISNSSTGVVNITGNISGGTFTGNTPAIYSSTAGFINVSGDCVAGSYPALFSSNILATNVVGGLVFNTASTPYYAYRLNVTPTASTITSTNVTGGTKIFTTSGYTYGIPLSGNVRSGIGYGYMNEYIGSMNIPSKHSVKIGTPFDSGNTYGEAIITTNDLNTLFKSFSFTGL